MKISVFFIIGLLYSSFCIASPIIKSDNDIYMSTHPFDRNLYENQTTVFLFSPEINNFSGVMASGVSIDGRILTAKHVLENSCVHPVSIYNYHSEYIGDISECNINKSHYNNLAEQVQSDWFLAKIKHRSGIELKSAKIVFSNKAFQINASSAYGFGSGLSGSPVFNCKHQVIGIISMINFSERIPTRNILNEFNRKIINIDHMDQLTITQILMSYMYRDVVIYISTMEGKNTQIDKTCTISGFAHAIASTYSFK